MAGLELASAKLPVVADAGQQFVDRVHGDLKHVLQRSARPLSES
jgi:hypothetical protein